MAMRPSTGAPNSELDIETRLQTAREQFQQRLALIKRDLLLGQAEPSQAVLSANSWVGEPHPSRVLDSESVGSGGGDAELTAQVPRTTLPHHSSRQRNLTWCVCVNLQASHLRESLADFFDELYPQMRSSGGGDGQARPMDALEQSRLARERALAHVQALKQQVSSNLSGTAEVHRRSSPTTQPTVDSVHSSDGVHYSGGRDVRELPARLGQPSSRQRKDAASYQMRSRHLSKAEESIADTSQRQRYGSVSGLTARKPRGRYRASAWAASSSGRFPPGKEMSDPGAYDPPPGMQLDSNAKFPGGQPLPTAAFDSTSKRFPDHGSIWRPPSDNIPGPGRYDPIDADDWMFDTRRPCYNF